MCGFYDLEFNNDIDFIFLCYFILARISRIPIVFRIDSCQLSLNTKSEFEHNFKTHLFHHKI